MAKKIHILFLGESEDIKQGICTHLSHAGYELSTETVNTVTSLEQFLAKRCWDLIITVCTVPGISAFAVLALLRERKIQASVIAVSEKCDPEEETALMKAGVRDCLPADHLQRVVPVVERELQWLEESRELQQAVEQLVQADRMKTLGTLVSGIIHEINNPNNFILFNVPMLAKILDSAWPLLDKYYRENGDFLLGGLPYSEMKENVPRLLSGINSGAHRIKKIVDTLKEYIRPESGDRQQSVCLNTVVRDALDITGHLVRKSTRHFSFSPVERLPAVHGSHQRLEQVVINLVENACQALPDPERPLKIILFHDPASRSVVLKIMDGGTGISPEHLTRITEPFFTTRRENGGTGLGLSIVARIIQEHKGTLHFDSKAGEGTTVTITLPVI